MAKGPGHKRTLTSWWDQWPGRLRQELEAFEKFGAKPVVVLQAGGILILSIAWPRENREPLALRVGFSPLHPFVRPFVAAPNDSLIRHQNPFAKELCLLTQDSHQWRSTQLIADYLSERLQNLDLALSSRSEGRPDKAAQLEEQAADPKTAYFAPLATNGFVAFDGEMPSPRQQLGLAKFACWDRSLVTGDQAIEGVLTELQSIEGGLIRAFRLPFNPPGGIILPGRWVRAVPPFTLNPTELLAAADREVQKQGLLQPRAIQTFQEVARGDNFFTAFMFDEELEYGKFGPACIFIFSFRQFQADGKGALQSILVRGERASESDIFSRLPVASGLRKKTVLLVGCGAVGGFVAMELARAGIGRLLLLDRDYVQPGNSLRWPLGRTAWGIDKPKALSDFIARNYPWTSPVSISVNLGSTAGDPAHLPDNLNADGPLVELQRLIDEVDVVVDASASSEIQHALQHCCRLLGKPYVLGYGTEGLVGGVVARFLPEQQGCWACLQEHLNDGAIPLRSDPSSNVVPVGCNAPTFTGAAFDSEEISLEIVRTTVGLLTNGSYDPGHWSVAVLDMRDNEGRRTPPSWSALKLSPHPKCCGKKG